MAALECTTEDELKKINTNGNSESCHLDSIPTTLLKDCIICLLPTLTQIVNTSILTSTMPPILKAATVTPLLKKPELDPENMKNYRLVSNLPYISKLIEKAIVTQLDSHMSENSLHEIHQSAYRKYHSTETAWVKILYDLLCAMDNS